MPAPPAPVSSFSELVMLGLGMCLVLAVLFGILAREVRARWALTVSLGFGLYAAGFAAAIPFAGLDAHDLARRITVAALPYLALSVGVWQRTAGPGLPLRDVQLAVTLGFVAAVVATAWAGHLDLPWAVTCAAAVWLSWALRFGRAARRRPDERFGVVAVSCLVYPLLAVAVVARWLPAGTTRAPGVLPLAAFGFALLTTGVLGAHRQAVAARAAAEDELRRRREVEASLRALNESLERRVAERTASLQETIEGLESFNRSVSHDLRGPLGGIAGAAELAGEALARGDEDGTRRLLGALAGQARASVEAVDALLWLARSGSAPLAPADVDLDGLLREVVDALRDEGALGDAEVACGSLGTVRGDPALLRQLLRNLVGNAAKFTRGRPSPRIEVSRTGLAGEGVFHVRDNGTGFAPEEAARLFRPFVRGDAAAGREGTGIGLSIVKRIVARHGGWIRAEGRPGQGATFSFTLPGPPAAPADPAATGTDPF